MRKTNLKDQLFCVFFMSSVWSVRPLLDSRAPSGAWRSASHCQMQEIIFGPGQWMACILSLRACLWQYIRPSLDLGPIQSYPSPRPEHTNVRKLTLLSLNFCIPDGRVIKVAWIKGEMQQFSSYPCTCHTKSMILGYLVIRPVLDYQHYCWLSHSKRRGGG